MKISKRQLRRIIREEKRQLLEGYKEEREKAAASTHFKPSPQFPKMTYPEDRAKAKVPQHAEDIVMEALEEFIDALSAGNSAVEIEALLTQLVGRAVDIAVRDEVIPEKL